ncbi:nose resistant to fluoxetine protein 6-like [Brevipalpus obovatus]|uniref:nose resistant to fluoxetine protein 6-like n=1 Tax=Brevipalpus obovatus TaxID=246614 RepID=UPI003D9F73ED
MMASGKFWIIFILLFCFLLNECQSSRKSDHHRNTDNNVPANDVDTEANDDEDNESGSKDEDKLDNLVDEVVHLVQQFFSYLNNAIREEVYNKSKGLTGLEKEKQAWIGYRDVLGSHVRAFADRLMPDLADKIIRSGISADCTMALSGMVNAIRNQKSWALKMIDSSGRPFSSGFIDGTITDFGSYDQCLDLNYQSIPGSDEKAQYCMIHYGIRLPPKPPHLTLQTRLFNFTGTSVEGTVFEEIADLMHICYERVGRVGVCLPSACSNRDLQTLVSHFFENGHLQANVSHCEVKSEMKLDRVQKPIAWVFSVILIFTILGTFWDIVHRCREPPLPGYKESQRGSRIKDILFAFSIPQNLDSLFDTKRKPGSLEAIDGIRVLSMAWIIWTHTYLIPIKETFAFARNYILAVEGFLFQFILNGWVLVDTFFCIGAMVAVYSTLNSMSKTRKINFVEIVVNRFFRFSPSVWFTVMLLFLMPSLASGPLWGEYFTYQINKCQNYWWATVLFFNNWFPEAKICMLHTWYLSADMQLFIFSLVFFIPLYKWGRKGLLLPYSFICLGVLSVFLTTFINRAAPTVIYNTPTEVISDGQALSIYTPTYIHLGPYCIGIVAGFLVYSKRQRRIPLHICITLWTLSMVGCLAVLFYTYTWNIGNPWTPLSSATYASAHRSCWALCIAWITFACVTGNGGFINSFLSWKGFIPLGKLSFMMYLMHFPILWMRYAYLRERLPFGHYTMFCEFIVNFVLSFFAALISYLMVEAPTTRIQRTFLSKKFPWATVHLKSSAKNHHDKDLVLDRLS